MDARPLASTEKDTGDDGIAIEEKSVVVGARKRGKALKGIGVLDGT